MENFISLYHQPVYSRDVVEACFFCVEHNLSGLSVTPDMLAKARDLLPNEFLLASCVDFPGGISGCDIKCHSAISNIRRGASCIDFVANPSHLLNSNDLSEFKHEVSSVFDICVERGVSFRVMIDYRFYGNRKIITIFNVLKEIGVKNCFLSTGQFSDDITDQLALSRYAGDMCEMNVIYNGRLWSINHYNKVQDAEIYGACFKSLQSYKSTFGVL
jgi:deoxyribose-phosphate aldolase